MTPEQLKASILQRAMEGKLVPQDPTDEPASELLKRIKAEKENLIADGKIKRDKKETELFRGADGKPYEKLSDGTIKEVEVPYDIPASWEWVRLRNISSLSFFPNISGDKIPNYSWVLDMEDIEKETGRLVRKNYKTEKSSYKSNKVYFSKDTVLYAKLRPNLKKVIISDEDGFATTELIPIKIFGGISAEYMRYCMISPSYYFNIIKSVYGVKMPRVNATFLNSTLLPLPPLSEQKRIVEQIERALEKVDAYSESYNKLQELDKSFPDKLKKSILQYTMQGKLVPQDPNDEPVEVLLEKIQAEKQKLYEEGKLKKKDLAEIVVTKGDDNSPYRNSKKNSDFVGSTMAEIPNSWSYVKFGSIVTFNIGKTPPRNEPTYWGNDIPWVSISDMPSSGHITKTKECISHLAIKQTNIKIVPADTLLMSFKLSIGKVAILDVPASHNEAIISIFPYSDKKNIIRNYLMMFLPLISTAGNSKDAIKGKTLNSTSISELLIPISNYREMKKIVSKVDLLFQKVAQLSD
ncbi:restriction endonuclease subunit S [Streptococcus agalactiae]|uniref:restriction endonuclease subunit S n=4 Tax=Streptococcus agalactiae TaxID=1311 RepID=UPI0013752C3A|nr:restriction endonuclease subunit S [Streptococcus agalactiae]KAF1117660.1 restriction endonuclease subunit S [Streptococcus agalactiae]